jgi:hypothetical protein
MQRPRNFALALLLLLGACDKFRAIPGVEPRSTLPPKGPPDVVMGPWLLEPQMKQMTIAWVTVEPSVGRVWYGQQETGRLATEEGPPVTEHRVVLPALQPATQYRFQVEGAQAGGSWFTTAPEPGDGGLFSILVYGDNRTNSGDHSLVVRAAAAERAPLALHTGDMVVDAKDPVLWRQWFLEERDLLSHTPLIATVGNHEMTDDGVAYSKYFQRRGLPPYWSVDYGPVHIAVLDSFEKAAGPTPHSAGVSDAQKAWLEEDLRRVPADRHVWALVHQGPYAHPAHARPGHGGSEAVKSALAAAQMVHNIEVVFAGHEHFYERGEIAGLKYFVLGGGGAPLEDPDPSAPGVLSAQKALSYATVEVCGCHVNGKAKDISGKVIDSFKLADCATPCNAPTAVSAAPAVAPEKKNELRKRNRRRRSASSSRRDGAAK